MKQVALAAVKDNLSRYIHEAGHEQIIITRHDKPVGVLIGFETDDAWSDYKIENNPRFLLRIAHARADLKAGKGIPWEKINDRKAGRTKDSSRLVS